MSYYRFGAGDVLRNVMKTYPEHEYIIYGGNSYLNGRRAITGSFDPIVGHNSLGTVNLYELNPDKDFTTPSSSPPIEFFRVNNGLHNTTKLIDTDELISTAIGEDITYSAELESGISFNYFRTGDDRNRLRAIRNHFRSIDRLTP